MAASTASGVANRGGVVPPFDAAAMPTVGPADDYDVEVAVEVGDYSGADI